MKVILHNIRSSHNVGSMFRTADAAGISEIYLTGYTPAPVDKYGMPNNKVLKVSLGAEDFVDWFRISQVSNVIDNLKSEGCKIYAVEQDSSSIVYNKLKLTKKQLDKAVLIMGNEVRGLHPSILKKADKVLEIPMLGKKSSLNVSVAFGIVAFHLVN